MPCFFTSYVIQSLLSRNVSELLQPTALSSDFSIIINSHDSIGLLRRRVQRIFKEAAVWSFVVLRIKRPVHVKQAYKVTCVQCSLIASGDGEGQPLRQRLRRVVGAPMFVPDVWSHAEDNQKLSRTIKSVCTRDVSCAHARSSGVTMIDKSRKRSAAGSRESHVSLSTHTADEYKLSSRGLLD